MKKYYFFEIFEMLVTIMICFGQIKLIKQALSKTSIIWLSVPIIMIINQPKCYSL